ncbi:hypothetical protein DFP72DRAFT_869415 [Ephemerocybe angulata]|uniref:Uncharacterized protein n=1 Tax=Ephemerocybe angulata TaxID=980116 RepID=A0A8H6IFU2_9AGAR|nr:hypothetical protein DFP72DRAFT_869415 [Tulosesus angulatus]
MASLEASLAKGLYSGLPNELREEVLSYCDKGELAAISSTDKGFGAEAERWLYRTVSLHESRLVELIKCLDTLAKNPKKAGMVESLAVSFYDHYQRRTPEDWAIINSVELMVHLAQALLEMRSLTFLSFRPHEGMDTKLVMRAIGTRIFKLNSLFMTLPRDYTTIILPKDSTDSTTITLPWLLECQPALEVIGLWGCGKYDLGSGIHLFLGMSPYDLNGSGNNPLVIGMSLRGSNFMNKTESHITLYSYDCTGLNFEEEFPVINDGSLLGEHMWRDLSLEDFDVEGSGSDEITEVSVVVPDLGPESLLDVTPILYNLNTVFNMCGKTLTFLVPPLKTPVDPKNLEPLFDFVLTSCCPMFIIFDFDFAPIGSWEDPFEEDEELRITQYIADYLSNSKDFLGLSDLRRVEFARGGYIIEVDKGVPTVTA